MGTRVTEPACLIRVGDKVRLKSVDVRLTVIEVILDGHAAWCEVDHGQKAGCLILRNVRDLLKIGYLH